MEEISRAIVDGSLDAISKKDKDAERHAEMVRQDLINKGARVVEPYCPNRKQRRAMESRHRQKGKVK